MNNETIIKTKLDAKIEIAELGLGVVTSSSGGAFGHARGISMPYSIRSKVIETINK